MSRALTMVPIEFQDVEDGKKRVVGVEQESNGVALNIPDHGEMCTVPGRGPIVFLEFRSGVPYLLVWADIQKEEPTHTISLERANEKYRLPD